MKAFKKIGRSVANLKRVGTQNATFKVEITLLELTCFAECNTTVKFSVQRGTQKPVVLPAITLLASPDKQKLELPVNTIPIESKFYIKDGIPDSKMTTISIMM